MACTGWHVIDPSPVAFAAQSSGRVRVTLTDSTQVTWNRTVMIDRRIGSAPNAAPGVLLTDVRRLEVRRVSWTKTALMVGLIAGITAAAAKGFKDAMNFEMGWSWNWN